MRLGKLMLAALFTLAASSAHADLTFTFSYSFPGINSTPTPVSASGVLTTTNLDPLTNAYTITGISGTRDFNGTQQTITGLLAPNSFGGNDNLLFATAPLLDVNGFSYTVNGTGSSGSDVNVYYDSSVPGYTEDSGNIGYGTFTATPTPEPGSIALLAGLGVTGAGFLARRRNTRKAI